MAKPPGQPDRETIALVLAGGGARGAYEIGVLSALLPALPANERPNLIVGTSVGALNGAFLAANLQREPKEALRDGGRIWREIEWEKVLAAPWSPVELERALHYLLRLVGVSGMRVPGLLDSSPLERTVGDLISFEQIERNVSAGTLEAAAVVATSALTSRSVVFHQGGLARHSRDLKRGIDYVATELTEQHVRASAAIPAVFPAVRVEREPGRGWYFDGGTRLNTPIKPALWLGAERVVAIGLNSIAAGPDRIAGDERPDVFDGAAQLTQALLADPLVEDVRTLTTVNELLEGAAPNDAGGDEGQTRRRLRYIFVAPPERDTIGQIACDCFREHYGSLLDARRSPELALLGRLIDGDAGPVHGELLSYLFFAPEFGTALLERGREDGQRWVDELHDDGLWDVGPLGRERGPRLRPAGEQRSRG